MFTTSCFIRKNTFAIRAELCKLGYENSIYSVVGDAIATSQITSHYTTINQKMYDDFNPHSTWSNNRIDCGDNEELFLAIAALRDDTDINQYFICDKISITLGKTYYPDDYLYYQYDEFFDKQNWHKATVKELIEHFKQHE